MCHIMYWCKWITSYFYVMIFRRSIKSRFDSYDMDVEGDPYKANFLPFPEETTLESPLPESQLITTVDEVFFYGVDSKSEYIITRIARGTNHEAEAWIYLKLSNGKIYELPETSGFQQSSSDKRIFSCGGLQIHYLSPMRIWRIFFSGLLKETNENGVPSDKKVHVKFALLWRASTDPFDFKADVNSKALVTSLAKATWNQRTPPLKKLFSALDFYAQCGNIMGTITINGSDELDIYLFGERLRFFGDVSSLKGIDFFHVLGHVSKNGRFVHIVEVSLKNVVERLTFGFATSLTGGIRPIHDKDCFLEKFVGEEKYIEASFQTAGRLFRLKGTLAGNQKSIQNNKNWDGCLTIDCLDFDLNYPSAKEKKSLREKEFNSLTGGQIGRGIIINGKITKLSRKVIPEISSYNYESVTPLVAHFSEKTCQNTDITGGKGSSLGKLTELSKEFQNFVVPKGIVVTTRAYELFVTDDILKGIKYLENVLYQNEVEETKAACQRLMDEFVETPIPDNIFQAVVLNLQNLFSDRKQYEKFAVRSSATGEDTDQMSAAGQMETYLGVSGITEIMTAIKKCWASQFSYIAVQYKRQNGQMINIPMAVVVQEMISCDVAGVLFTCDPLTGNPTTMTITANYGLGESVVSGSEEPDTIEIERLDGDNMSIKNKIIGSKSHKIILKDGGGTIVEDVGDNEKQTCCLSDNTALQLGHIAVIIEKSYRSYRDIEWGLWNNNLYIFQSRPLTSGSGETDFEIDHEFDAALRCEDDFFALCNVGEVFSGASTPLSLDITKKYFQTVLQGRRFLGYHIGELRRYYQIDLVSMYSRVMLLCIDLFKLLSENNSQPQVIGLAYFGRVVNNEELFEMAKERFSDDFMKLLDWKMYMKAIYMILYGAKLKLKQYAKTYKEYTVSSVKYNNSREMFDHVLSCHSDLTLSLGVHYIQTNRSVLLNTMIFAVLQKAAGEINTDVYNDYSKLMACSESESAEVPAAIEKLALSISKEIKPDDFKSISTKEALRWLETTPNAAGENYRDFLTKHGHRCLREFDLYSLTWEMDPLPLVKLLQNLVGSVKEERFQKKQEDFEKIISGLKTPITYCSKFLLKIILPASRKAVQNRECSKSIVIRVINEWRKEFRNLAKLMVLEGRIPDEDILFFMTLEEVKELFETRSPRILSKANHRRRRHPILDKYFFPELIKGFPKPVNANDKIAVDTDDNFSMKGVPVSQGEATGIVRVALDLKEASLLQPGEILVTYSTDIGWSPYFPILGGVVTEIGGLISHGAVISREYGLPCIAGLHGATQHFKTGDFVLLNGTKGILQRLPKPEDS